MDANSKLEHAKKGIAFVALSHDDGEVAVKAHLKHLRDYIDELEAGLPAARAEHARRQVAIADRKEAARKARDAEAREAEAAKAA